MDSKKAEALGRYTMNLITPDNGEKFAIDLSNGTFTNVEGFLHDDPDLAITIDRADLELIMAGLKRFTDAIEDGTAEAEGNAEILNQIAGTLGAFNPFFEVLPGTAAPASESQLNPYEVQGEATYIRGE